MLNSLVTSPVYYGMAEAQSDGTANLLVVCCHDSEHNESHPPYDIGTASAGRGILHTCLLPLGNQGAGKCLEVFGE